MLGFLIVWLISNFTHCNRIKLYQHHETLANIQVVCILFAHRPQVITMFARTCTRLDHSRKRGEMSHKQNTFADSGESDKFSAISLFMTPAVVFLPPSSVSRRPVCSTRNTAIVMAVWWQGKKTENIASPITCHTILLNVSVNSTAGYFYEVCSILASHCSEPKYKQQEQ